MKKPKKALLDIHAVEDRVRAILHGVNAEPFKRLNRRKR